jgi:hypothetical protein
MTDGVRELDTTQHREDLVYSLGTDLKRWIDQSLREDSDYFLRDAYIPVPPGAISGILGTIRRRVLQFVIELQREYPELAEGEISDHAPTQRQLTQIFNVTIAGGSGFSVGGNTFVNSINQQVIAGDLESLRSFLLDQGVTAGEVAELEELLPEATPAQLDDEGSPIRRWVGSAAGKIAAGGSDLLKTAAKEIIKQAVGAYLDRTLGTQAVA